jgi:hypothetical protein
VPADLGSTRAAPHTDPAQLPGCDSNNLEPRKKDYWWRQRTTGRWRVLIEFAWKIH